MRFAPTLNLLAAWRRPGWFGLGRLLCCLGFMQGIGAAAISAPAASPASTPSWREDRILVQPKPGVSLEALARFHTDHEGTVLSTFEGIGGLQVVSLPKGETVQGFIAKYQQSGLVEFAEPDFVGWTATTTPNDPLYTNGTLWALHNYGQNGGTPGADINAAGGWDILNSASNIVVAVLDTGVRYTHEDLAANMWVNPRDGSHGWNAIAGNNDPNEDPVYSVGHGTKVAGIIGAVGNNGKGVVGVAWKVQLMACTCFNRFGAGNISDVITCLDFARTNGARLINASWGFGSNSLAFSNAIYSARGAGIIVAAACGNSGTNIDVSPSFPIGYHLDNVVSVAATANDDSLAGFSNYGATNVHLAAPGVGIWSTWSPSNIYYYFDSGTSFSAPYVTGALALMLAQYPGVPYQQIISLLLAATDPLPGLAGKCVSGGRLNLRKALSRPRLTALPTAANAPFQFRVSAGSNRTCIIQAAPGLTGWSSIFTNTTSANGTFDFTDTQSTNLANRFYRAVASP